MDKAICGENMRCGHSRCGVYTDHWEVFKDGIEKRLAPRNIGGIDPAVWFSCRWFYFRWFMTLPLWGEFKQGVEKRG